MDDRPPRLRFGRQFWGLNTAVWSLLATTTLIAVAADLARAGRPIDWTSLLAFYAAAYAPWIAITPFVFLWVDHYPPAQASWSRLLLQYCPIAVPWLLFYVPAQSAILSLARHSSLRPVFEVMREFPLNQVALDGVYLIALVGVAVAAHQGRNRLWREQQASELKLANAGLEARLSAARLEMLRAQLEPHFLYNALNSISALIHQGLSERATEAVHLLSELLRYATRATHQDSVPLSEEIDFAEAYWSFQKIRYGERLDVHIEVEPDVLAIPLPPLILQPLLENAIRHGVEALEAPSRVELLARRVGDQVDIRINNFPGRQSGRPGLGVGLANVRARLQWHYRRAIEIELMPAESTSPGSDSENTEGFTAHLKLPAEIA